jgi:hypothetical protein
MAVASLLLAVATLADPPPPPPASAILWDRNLGPLRIEIVRELTWPGAYLPAFTLAHGQRVVQRLTLGFTRGPLRPFSFDAVTVGAASDPRVAMTSAQPTAEGLPILALRGSVAVPRTPWRMSALQAFTGYTSSSPTPLVGPTVGAIGTPTALLWRRF